MFNFKFNIDTLTPMAAYLFELKRNSSIVPRRLFIFPTALCDDKCKYCVDGLNAGDAAHLQYDKEKDFFSNRIYIDKLVSDIKALKIIDLHIFGGGEPFFYKANMFYFLNKLKDIDIFIRIITNANNLNDEDIRMIIENKLISQLNISFSTDTEITAAKIYAKAVRHTHSLEILKSITKYKNIHKTDFPKVHIMFIILNVNYNKVAEIIELLKEYAIEFFMFQPLRVSGNVKMDLALSPEQEQEFIANIPYIEKLLKKHNMRSNIDSLKPGKNVLVNAKIAKNKSIHSEPSDAKLLADNFYGADLYGSELINKHGLEIGCHMPLTTTSICYNGNIPFCQFKYSEQYRANYFDLASLNDFTQSQEYKTFTSYFTNGTLPVMCRGCIFCTPDEFEAIKRSFKNLTETLVNNI